MPHEKTSRDISGGSISNDVGYISVSVKREYEAKREIRCLPPPPPFPLAVAVAVAGVIPWREINMQQQKDEFQAS